MRGGVCARFPKVYSQLSAFVSAKRELLLGQMRPDGEVTQQVRRPRRWLGLLPLSGAVGGENSVRAAGSRGPSQCWPRLR